MPTESHSLSSRLTMTDGVWLLLLLLLVSVFHRHWRRSGGGWLIGVLTPAAAFSASSTDRHRCLPLMLSRDVAWHDSLDA